MLSKRRVSLYLSTGLVTLVAALPFSIKITSLLSILLVVLWILELVWLKKRPIAWNELWVPFFTGFYMLHILGLLYTQNLGNGLFDLEKKLSLLIFPLILGSSPSLRKDNDLRNKVHTWFIVSCLLALIYCLVHGMYRYINEIPTNSSVYGGFEATQQFKAVNQGVSNLWDYITYAELLSPLQLHPTYSSLFILLVIFILLDKVLQTGVKRKIRLAYNILFLFFIAAIFLIASRIAILLLLLLLPLQLCMRARQLFSWKKLAMIATGFILLLIILINFVPVVKHRFANDLNSLEQAYSPDNPGTGMTMRLTIWRTAVEIIKKNPIIGVGTGDVDAVMTEHYEANGVVELAGYNPHNQYLHTAVMLGAVGTLYLLLTLFLPFVVALKRRDTIYLLFLMIVGVTFFTESVLQSNKGIVFYSLFNSLYLFNFPKSNSIT